MGFVEQQQQYRDLDSLCVPIIWATVQSSERQRDICEPSGRNTGTLTNGLRRISKRDMCLHVVCMLLCFW